MKRKVTVIIAVALLLTACSADIDIGIQRHTAPGPKDDSVVSSFPEYTDLLNLEPYQIDFRSMDLSGLDLTGKLVPLLHSDFDSSTKWPEELPDGFSPSDIIELGKDPGLGVRTLHDQGIDGSGVSIAIIDMVLYTEHSEYADRLKHYEEIPASNGDYAMHGNAVASLAVGKTVGVAPKASLYFIASELRNADGNITYEYYAQAIHRILDINKQLPKSKRIKAITIARGWSSRDLGYQEVNAAISRAKEEGVFIISTSLEDDYGFCFAGLDREPQRDPNDINNYSVGSWQKNNTRFIEEDSLFFPMDSRAYASWTGENDYSWGWQGGWSWVVPYITGLYALCAQVYPNITPELFWETAINTSDTITVDNVGEPYTINHLINPVRLLNGLNK